VLAGGEGVRLRPLVRELCGDERPKQFAKIVGSKSLLSHTLDRVALKIPPEQTVIVTCRAHGKYMAQEFPEAPRQRVLVQPEDRGTAAGIFFPAHWIDSQDPEAVVAVFPSDHFILEESAFMSHVANVAAYVQQESGRLVLFGATANEPDTEYGWIEPGGPWENSALIPSYMSTDSGKSLRRAARGPAWRAAVYGTRWCLLRKYQL
jgi:mannose-1-phosphate guanylyltransferase